MAPKKRCLSNPTTSSPAVSDACPVTRALSSGSGARRSRGRGRGRGRGHGLTQQLAVPPCHATQHCQMCGGEWIPSLNQFDCTCVLSDVGSSLSDCSADIDVQTARGNLTAALTNLIPDAQNAGASDRATLWHAAKVAKHAMKRTLRPPSSHVLAASAPKARASPNARPSPTHQPFDAAEASRTVEWRLARLLGSPLGGHPPAFS